MVGDKEGVVIIPAHILQEIADEVKSMTIYEDYVIEKIRKGSSIKGLYPLTDEKQKSDFDDWLKSN